MKTSASNFNKTHPHKNGKEHSTPRTGILEWFHFKDYEHVEKTLKLLKKLGIQNLRTGFSWADYHRPDGQEWFDWLIPTLGKELNILPCFLYTPPSIGLEPKTSSPPEEPLLYGHFVGEMIDRYEQYIEYVELWNEPNNMSEYDFTLDTDWTRFVKMISYAADNAHERNKKVVLGGMSPIDPNWLEHMRSHNLLSKMDAVGIHGFPNVFDSHWPGWDNIVKRVNEVLYKEKNPPELWITEAGYSTWLYNERQQLMEFIKLLEAPVDRIYWYSLMDLAQQHATVDGFHLDEREYHFGLYKSNGNPKLLARLIEEKGPSNVIKDEWMAQPYISSRTKGMDDQQHVLITGGAGFIGINLAHTLLNMGHKVTILDNLSREGVLKNLRWIKKNHHNGLNIEVGDIRNPYLVEELVKDVDMIFHFAAQVAVTTSLEDPFEDYQINTRGTINILNAMRQMENAPPIIFTSTNKVYGALEDMQIVSAENRYEPQLEIYREKGISEKRPLDFHSPYGCSKGAADQYILDHARSVGIKSVVFRMSCIYGTHQCGNEDQGWVAHFLISALKGESITIYGDGKQVRDLLYIQDLIDAFLAAWRNINSISGEAFNIGGGRKNSASLLQVLDIIQDYTDNKLEIKFDEWRKGDQRYYVSDTDKFQKATGWKPRHSYNEGIAKLAAWLKSEGLVNVKSKRSKKELA